MVDKQRQANVPSPLVTIKTSQKRIHRQFWLCVFSVDTWNVALDNNCLQAAFPAQRLRTAGRIRAGDVLFVYLLGARVIAGSLKATSAASLSEQDSIFQPSGRFPVVLPTSSQLIIPRDKWLPMAKMVNKLSIFRGIRDQALWHHALRTSPRSLTESDGCLLEKEISDIA
jgi:hypothetical protein